MQSDTSNGNFWFMLDFIVVFNVGLTDSKKRASTTPYAATAVRTIPASHVRSLTIVELLSSRRHVGLRDMIDGEEEDRNA